MTQSVEAYVCGTEALDSLSLLAMVRRMLVLGKSMNCWPPFGTGGGSDETGWGFEAKRQVIIELRMKKVMLRKQSTDCTIDINKIRILLLYLVPQGVVTPKPS